MEILRRIVQTFAYVMAGITISAALFITIFIPEEVFQIELLWQIIILSAVCSLGNFIYYFKEVPSKKQMKLRIICHYSYINLVVLGGAFLWGWVTPGILLEFLAMLALIAVVYFVVMVAIFRQEVKTAENINRQLREQYPDEEEGEDL
jgi:hypothetical protein